MIEHAAKLGFTSLEISCRFHLRDMDYLDSLVRQAANAGLSVNGLDLGGALLAPDPAAATESRVETREALGAAAVAGVPRVTTHWGRNPNHSEADDYRELGELLNVLIDPVAGRHVRLLAENYPGRLNNNLESTPAAWDEVFKLAPSDQLGLTFDPSHLVRLGVDHEAAYRRVARRTFAVHAKDTEIFADRLQQLGWMGGRPWWTYRLPGRGQIDWTRFFMLLAANDHNGPVTVEHEDPDWGGYAASGPLELRLRALKATLSFLKSIERLTDVERDSARRTRLCV